MLREATLATRAKALLRGAAGRLGAANPLEDVGAVIDAQMGAMRADPLDTPLSANFSEQTPDHLQFVMRAADPALSGADRIEVAGQAMNGIVRRRLGAAAATWLDGRMEPVVARDHMRGASWGAAFGSAYDRSGLTESFIHCEWGPGVMEALPAPLHRMARLAMESLPGLKPAITTIRCGRNAGSQQISFEIDRSLALADLAPLMDRFGLGHQHAGLMSAVAFILGARFRLPPDAAMLTLRPTQAGPELRLDVNLDAIPDVPAQLMALMRLQMTERPRSIVGLDRWLMAMTPEGYPGPGTVSVLSVWVRPDLPARIALYLRPVDLDPHSVATAPQRQFPAPPSPPMRPAPAPPPSNPMWSSSAWAPQP